MHEESKSPEENFNKKSFSQMIENFVYHNKLSYMDTIVHLCEENGSRVGRYQVLISHHIDHLEVRITILQLHFLPKRTR